MKRKNERNGQGLTEYVILIVLVAIGVLGAVKVFGWRVEEKFDGASIEVEFAAEEGNP
ncbi:MAG: hypothetical protein HY720_13200 [Planctomycetes bacterium]|nr:hypothetical protein [Planctomycetota bacterium]